MRTLRKIVKIDEEKCDGCGQCVPACAEGALQIIDGKARLVSDTYCDGLGACLGKCPQGAITIEEREAEEFDEEVAEEHLKRRGLGEAESASKGAAADRMLAAGCPGSAVRTLRGVRERGHWSGTAEVDERESLLGNWPVQIKLVPVRAPYLDGARLLISADCAPFALGDFHREFLEGKVLLVGCPKLDDAELYRRKLAEIFRRNEIQAIEVVHVEVPCCYGLVRIVRLALEDSGKDIPTTLTEVGIRGEVRKTVSLQANGG